MGTGDQICMSAPVIWILLPLAVATVMSLINNQRLLSILGGSTAVALAALAQFVPMEEAMRIGPLSLKINSSLEFLGRSLQLRPAEGHLLALVYSTAALWLFGAEAANVARRIVPLGMIITALLVASIAVQPFLFAALFIEMAILLSIPLLVPMNAPPRRGVIRFLIYQTLGMPFILLAGWLLAGVEASPGDVALVAQSGAMLGLGFAFLLAVFPFYNWIPMVMEEASPFIVGFLLWILPTMTLIFGMNFLDRYSWLRSAPQLVTTLRLAGLLMVVTGGLWAAFQHHLGRVMAYAAITEMGFTLLALSLDYSTAVPLIFLLIAMRGPGLAVWSLSLTIFKEQALAMRFSSVKGMLRKSPIASAGILLASLSTAGFPLLAGFPTRLALWESLARASLGAAFWMGIGLLGLLSISFRMMAVLSMTEEYTSWERRESWTQLIMLGLGMIGLFILGIFPQLTQIVLADLPIMFDHLGR